MKFTEECRPLSVFKYFETLSSVPHGSGNTKAISDLCVKFAKDHGHAYVQDEYNNVIIYKDGSKGRENLAPVIIQGHLDMVCAKLPGDPTDMAKEPIKLRLENGYLSATDTSLGGDNAIAVAMALAVLDDDSLSHPPIEAVFTTDEETGMFGAAGLDASLLKGRRMLNLDSEEEGVFTAGCAGGVRANCSVPVRREKFGDGLCAYEVTVSGLLGGHSGCDIDKGRGSSNVLIGRFLHEAANEMPLRLCSMSGGDFDNVIPGKTTAVAAVSELDGARFEKLAAQYDGIFKNELSVEDPCVRLSVKPVDAPENTLTLVDTAKVLTALRILPNGIQNMDPDIKGLVQTSLNMGVLRLGAESFDYSFAIRSSVASRKAELLDRVVTATEILGGSVTTHGEYPGWEFRRQSRLRDTVLEAYRQVYGKEGVVSATHGGLECGLFMDKIPGLDCVSYGPELHDVHSVRERLGVASVGRVYDLTVRVLELLD